METRLEQLLAEHRYQTVLQVTEAFFADPLAPAEEAALHALYAARAAGRLERYVTAVAWAERGLTAGPTDPWVEGMLHLTLGTVLIYSGDIQRAERSLCRFLEMVLAHEGLLAYRPLALHNMAFIHRASRRFDQEIALFCEAANAYQECGDLSGVRSCRLELAWHHLSRENAEAATPHLAAVLASEAPMKADGELNLQVAIAWHKFLTGQTAEAEADALALLEQEGVGAWIRADVEWLLGKHALAQGDAPRAAKWAALASRHAAEAWLPAQMERAALLQREIAQYQSA
ncbi:MAG TPA: hypothetical protein VK191_08105 [Symbiobacteriaceae bacterium]|nr:hypothetical protein [Symbiobacteriaceae bacterium]